MQTIGYANKVALNENSNIPEINKVTDNNMNEIKSVVNANSSECAGEFSNLATFKTNTNNKFSGVAPMGSIRVDDINCKNMFNAQRTILGGYGSDGTFDSTASYITTQFIPVEPSTQYTLSSLDLDLTKYPTARIISWQEDMTFISRGDAITLSSSNTFTTPANAKWIAISFYTSQTPAVSDLTQGQLELGSTATTYTPFKETSNNQIYSESEVMIGRWINNKPIYRKVFTGLTASNTYTMNIGEDIDELINGYGYILASSGNQLMVNSTYGDNSGNAIRIYKNGANGNIVFQYPANASVWYNQKYVVVLEYTKALANRSLETQEEDK